MIQSVEDHACDAKCLLYPNPTRGALNVAWMGTAAPEDLVLRDLSGRVVMQSPLTMGTTQISTAGLAPGVYLASVGIDGTASRIVVE